MICFLDFIIWQPAHMNAQQSGVVMRQLKQKYVHASAR